jgi:SAM-dependent methyltransferase
VRDAAGLIINLDRANWFLGVPVPRDAVVLDIGAGTGALAHSLALYYSHVIAVEPVLEHITFMRHRFLQEKIDNVTLVRSQADMIPLPSQSVDLAIVNGVLEWIPSSIAGKNPRDLQLAALQTIHEILRPGGFVCIGIKNRWCIDFWLGANDPNADIPYVTLLPRFLADRYSQRKLGTPYRNYLYSIHGYRRLLQDAGFSQPRFFCAIPSYNDPAFIIPFDDTVLSYYHKHFGTSYGHAIRRALVRSFRFIGLDKYTTNSFFIIAGKADAHP